MPTGESRQVIRPSRQNLFRVWVIRNILIAALLAALTYLWHRPDIVLSWYPLIAVLVVMVAGNLALLYRMKLPWPVSEPEFFINLLLDVVFLTAILYLTGGSTNPLVSYYLIPLIISAAVLSPRYTWSIAMLTVSAYTVLFFRFVPFELFSTPSHIAGSGSPVSPHFLGMWVNFTFSAVLIAWFVVRMAQTMRAQETSIARSREDGMRNEQIISLAGVAAGTAHELRTPLATMAVLTDEMKSDHPHLDEELSLLQGQLDRCDSILRELISSTGHSAQKQTRSLAGLIRDVHDKWRIVRPEVQLDVRLPRDAEALELEYDQGLHHALLNFLHNAADVSPENVSLEASVDLGMAMIVIEDRGPGIPAEIADALGRQFVSRKEGGLGLGVLISSASIERLDGRVTMLNRPGGGTRLEIRLPLHRGTGAVDPAVHSRPD